MLDRMAIDFLEAHIFAIILMLHRFLCIFKFSTKSLQIASGFEEMQDTNGLNK